MSAHAKPINQTEPGGVDASTDLQRIAVKLYAADSTGFDVTALIPVFHGWIQRTTLDGLMLIDVADYSHVHQGPGVMLICYEGFFSVGENDGGLGLLYANKRLAQGTFQQRLSSATQKALAAAKLLESDPALSGKLTFRCDELLIRIDDRLHAPNTTETFAAWNDQMRQFLSKFYDDGEVQIQHVEDPKSGLTVKATSALSSDLATHLSRLT